MRFIDSKTHGFIDYIMSLFIAASPWTLDYGHGGMETWIPLATGIAGILYSLITDYEPGLSRILPMRTHLNIDLAAGILLLVSPWLFNFKDVVWQPHFLFGIIIICVSLFTKKQVTPSRKNPLINL
jgi:hypothetical protein